MNYGLQRVRYSSRPLEYVPDHGITHLFESGIIVFPSATSSVRLGFAHSAGRRTTAIGGQFEWEACNLLDRGCEFGGSPRGRSSTALVHFVRAHHLFDSAPKTRRVNRWIPIKLGLDLVEVFQ